MATKPLTYEELDGKVVIISAYAYQHLYQALNIVEARLADKDEPTLVDDSIDPELGCVHHSLMVATLADCQHPQNKTIINQIRSCNPS